MSSEPILLAQSDTEGYVEQFWISTYAGPVRKDGKTRRRFQFMNSSGLFSMSHEELNNLYGWLAQHPEVLT